MSPPDVSPGTPGQPIQSLPSDAFIVVPVRNTVLFPEIVFPITLGRPATIAAAQQAVREQRQILIVLQRQAETDDPRADDLYRVGTVTNIVRYVTTPDGNHMVICQGVQRFRITEFVEGQPFLMARGLHLAEPAPTGADIEARFIVLQQQVNEVLELLPRVPPELRQTVEATTSPGMLADLAITYLDATPAEKQDILETSDLVPRLDKVSKLLARRLEVLRLSAEIGNKTRESLEFAPARGAAARADGGHPEGAGRRGLQQAGAGRPREGDRRGQDAAGSRAGRAQGAAPPAAHARGGGRIQHDPHLPRTLIELPWAPPEPKDIDLAEARRVLDADHYGLEKIKKRIVEYLAVRKLAPEGKAPILCFVGPPGVGKTSLGQSIARAMGRKFTRISLGGLHDEAEIRGHRRTYIGAMPGNVIQAIRKAGASNSVIMLDEIDKIGAGMHGDPSAALLEVLDPEQNTTFRDNYLDVPFDLSRVVFITTANMLETIQGPLRDRMEIIPLSGYTTGEKLEIAKRYLVRRQLEANGLKAEQIEIEDAALRHIIGSYTREAGVRSLEREIGRVPRSVAVEFAEGATAKKHIGVPELEKILGPVRFKNEIAMRSSVPGVATGLAWTPVGGDILFIEATRTPGGGKSC